MHSFFLFFYIFICSTSLSLAQVPLAQQASGQESLRQQQERDQLLRDQLKKKPSSVTESVLPEEPTQALEQAQSSDQKVLIQQISLTGNTLLLEKEIRGITAAFEGKELSLSQMQSIADRLTDAYRQKGFITTRVILPPQQVSNNTLNLQVVQGVMGQLEVRGNRYFRKSLFTKKVSLKRGDNFNYNQLRNDLSLINQYPDRNVKTVITPGANAGETDVVFDVKDRLPIHAGVAYDNYGSRYVGKSRYTSTLTHNNLLGFDDIFTFQYQVTEANDYRVGSLRYLLPISKTTDLGLYASKNQLNIGREFESLESRGKSVMYSVFINQTLRSDDVMKVVASVGFDYKDVFNFQLGDITAQDRLRILKGGITADVEDSFKGRNILSQELGFGLPDVLAGLQSVDTRSSRVGAGGRFIKSQTDTLRLQQLPKDMSLLLKGQFQFASTILPSAEQYQLGGINNVRGFASGEATGDSGQTLTAELNIPFYFIPKGIKVPLSTAKLYDALRGAVFFDWGHVNLRNPQAGEAEDKTLSGAGLGLRLTLPESFSFKLDHAWSVKGRPSDENHQHTWVQVSKEF